MPVLFFPNLHWGAKVYINSTLKKSSLHTVFFYFFFIIILVCTHDSLRTELKCV